jgi:hypothetical protein
MDTPAAAATAEKLLWIAALDHGVFIHQMMRRRRRRRALSPTDTDSRAVDDCATAFSIGPPRNFECYPNGLATVNRHPPAHREGWMISGQETVFCWIPVP